MRDGAVPASLEAGCWDSCLPHVEEDRRDEQGREKLCAVLRGNIDDSISVQILHCGELYSVPCDVVAKHLVL